jgi:integrase
MFAWAVDDEMIAENPATGKWVRALGLVRSVRRRQEEVKAFTREQRDRFLASCRTQDARLRELCVGSFLTGMRLGETLVARVSDLVFERKVLRVEHAISSFDRVVRPPKAGHGRDVKLSKAALTFFEDLVPRRRAEAFKVGEKDPLLYPSTAWTPLNHRNIGRRFAAALKAAGLPAHFTPHSMRHTFATLELVRGTPIQQVQEQLGHASIQETVDTYGRWIPKENPLGDDTRDEAVVQRGDTER